MPNCKPLIFTHKEPCVLSFLAGDHVADMTKQKKDIVIGCATGNMQLNIYKAMRDRTDADYSHATAVFLDEHFGKTIYYNYAINELHEKFEDKNRAFKKENIFVPRAMFYYSVQIVNSDGLSKILEESSGEYEKIGPEICIEVTCQNPVLCEIRDANMLYENMIRERGITLQLLGIGRGSSPHTGFCEKNTRESSKTHLTELLPLTLDANKNDFMNSDGSRYAITQGISTILCAEEIILSAFGEEKAHACEKMPFGNVSRENPAAYIRKHENARMYIDHDALGDNIGLLRTLGYQVIEI